MKRGYVRNGNGESHVILNGVKNLVRRDSSATLGMTSGDARNDSELRSE